MISPARRQREFIPLFGFLLLVDMLATWLMQWGSDEFGHLLMLWFGPLDDIFYAIAGLQALYFLLDPEGTSRPANDAMGTIETVKTTAGLFQGDEARAGRFAQGFYEGSRRSLAFLSVATLATLAVALFHQSSALAAGSEVLQRQLLFLLPVSALMALLVRIGVTIQIPKGWGFSVLAGAGALVVSIAVDGRWGNHLLHLFLSLESLQAWGAAFCWVGLGARTGSGAHSVD